MEPIPTRLNAAPHLPRLCSERTFCEHSRRKSVRQNTMGMFQQQRGRTEEWLPLDCPLFSCCDDDDGDVDY